MEVKKPFDIINAIDKGERVDNLKKYDKFLTTRFYSYFIDTIMYSAEAAQFTNLENSAHYEYFFNAVKPKKRFSKWFKSEKDENAKIVAEYYDCSYSSAMDILKILTEEQLSYINEWYKIKENKL